MSLSLKLATLAVAVASILALVGAASASAAITEATVAGNTLTIKADGDADTIALGVTAPPNSVITFTANGEPTVETALPADENAEIIVESGAGTDTVNAAALVTANYKSLVVDGGEDNDSIIGGARAVASVKIDTLNGDADNDTLTGAKGVDIANGGEGNDVMVWNNGDGNDTNNGGTGIDESVFNGAPVNDEIAVTPGAVAGRVALHRTLPTVIDMDIEAEQTTFNGVGGNDKAAGSLGLNNNGAFLTNLTFNGGEGDDQLTGGDANDVLNGDADNDTLTGFKGTDIANGGDGNDVMVWNNGDGNDTNNGGLGNDESVFNGAPVADEIAVTPGAVAGRVLLHRTLPTVINMDIEAETTTFNGLAGEDKATGAAGLANLTTLLFSGGEGNDQLTGGDGADTLNGDADNDTLTGSAGTDTTNGGAGDDQLFARDLEADTVRGGNGKDSAQTDELTLDSVSEVENIDATVPPEATPPPVVTPPPGPTPDTVALLPRLGKVAVAASGKSLLAKVPLSCPADESGGCRTTLTVEAAKYRHMVLGTKSVNLGPGARMTAAIHLSPRTAKLALHGKLPVRIKIKTRDAAGNTANRTVTATLKVPRH